MQFEDLVRAIAERRSRSVYGHLSGLRLDRAVPGEVWSSLPYLSVFIGNTEAGVLDPGVVTAMLDESCGMAVQLAFDGPRLIATLDLRMEFHKPAERGADLRAHSVCHRVTPSVAFVRSMAYQQSVSDPVATAAASFIIGANSAVMPSELAPHYDLAAPEDPTGAFAENPFARCIGLRIRDDGVLVLPISPVIIGSPVVSAVHGGVIGALLETSAIAAITRDLQLLAPPELIAITINYLRSGRALDTFASASIKRTGRRVVTFEAAAWQDEPAKPIAWAFGNVLLSQTERSAETRI